MRVVISFVSPRYSQHILGLWKKDIQRVSKNKSNILSGRKGFFSQQRGEWKKIGGQSEDTMVEVKGQVGLGLRV